MILEHALLTVRPGRQVEFEATFAQARSIIAAMPGFRSLRLARGLEQDDVYLLLVEWDRLEDHTEGFRGSPEYQEWRRLLHHFYDPFPTVQHFRDLPTQDGHEAGITVGDGDVELDARLNEELTRYNVPAADAGPQRELTVQARDDSGGLVGGLSGWTWGTCAGVAMLWVREDARGDRWGSRLLEAAEREATARGCTQMVLSSFTFQAPDFYRRHGYLETGRTEGLPLDGMADVHFRKTLET